jgi:cellulose biosynthesis protein BcsQ
MYTRTRLSNQVIKEINKYFPDKQFKTIIPKNVSLAEAPTVGKPIMAYDPFCRGALAYSDLTKEIIENKVRIIKKEFSILPRKFIDFWETGAPPRHAAKRH